ncbi:MAG: regulatory protein RecX [Bacteroidia bacterium]
MEIKDLAAVCKFCAYQDRSRKEIETKLQSLAIPETEWEAAFAYLIQEKYFDEQRFVEGFVRGKFRMKQWGRKKILHEIRQHGISSEKAYAAMESEITEEMYVETLKQLIQRKQNELRKEKGEEAKAKIIRYLLQKGYESEDIYAALREVLA